MKALPLAVPANLDDALGLVSVVERNFLNFVGPLNFVFEKLGFKQVKYIQAWNLNQISATVDFDVVSKYRRWEIPTEILVRALL